MNETGEQPTILIVDDMPQNIDVLKMILAKEYRIKAALNGEIALEIVKSPAPPDLILLDIMMPRLDGYEVCRRLKADPETQAIPVIFVTAKDEVAHEIMGFDVGAVDYITKPISPLLVLARVKTQLALKAAQDKLARQNRELQVARQRLEKQNQELVKAARLREDVEQISRHDLKNPLTGLLSAPQLLLMSDNLTPSQRRVVKTIETCAYNMLEMINLTLDLFKMEQGMYELRAIDVNLMEIIERIRFEVQTLAETREASLHVQIEGRAATPKDTFWVRGETLMCYSMLANLIKNAIEASSKGETVSIFLEMQDLAVIRIQNQGIVPEEIQPVFFEKYATHGKNKGTGLGTYSARLIAETLGGRISMSTSKTEGTVVRVELPKA